MDQTIESVLCKIHLRGVMWFLTLVLVFGQEVCGLRMFPAHIHGSLLIKAGTAL